VDKPLTVPFLDLARPHRPLATAFAQDFADVVESSAFVNGPQVAAFEIDFARYCGTTEAVGMASGLDALRLALQAAELTAGAEVIVPAMTFVATWEAVSQSGGIPVPVDITDLDYNIDPDAVSARIGDRTAAIMPVHLYGQMADVERLLPIAATHGIVLVEDAAQAHGAERSGYRAGAAGDAAGFSFYPGKNLGAFGDAGALVTSDGHIATRARALREHGQHSKYHHDEVGWTARLDTIQAAVLVRKLAYLDAWNDERRVVAERYLEALTGVGDLVLPPVAEGSKPVWHVFVVRTGDPEGLAEHLRAEGIQTGRHYPQPPHLSGAYSELGYAPGAFPISERLARECLSLPIFPGMRESEVARVVESVRSWFAGG
jgi:dTDP-4-amino-4,6-dideoxygalactose transaminase